MFQLGRVLASALASLLLAASCRNPAVPGDSLDPPTAGSFLDSPDGRYRATKVGEGASVHYQVTEVKTGRVALTTRAQFPTPNDVKAGGFSVDSKRFAAAYHYSHEGPNTWIGVWDLETGKERYSRTKAGHTTDLSGVFDE